MGDSARFFGLPGPSGENLDAQSAGEKSDIGATTLLRGLCAQGCRNGHPNNSKKVPARRAASAPEVTQQASQQFKEGPRSASETSETSATKGDQTPGAEDTRPEPEPYGRDAGEAGREERKRGKKA